MADFDFVQGFPAAAQKVAVLCFPGVVVPALPHRRIALVERHHYAHCPAAVYTGIVDYPYKLAIPLIL